MPKAKEHKLSIKLRKLCQQNSRVGIKVCFLCDEICGDDNPIVGAHIMKKTHLFTRFDLSNIRPACTRCNKYALIFNGKIFSDSPEKVQLQTIYFLAKLCLSSQSAYLRLYDKIIDRYEVGKKVISISDVEYENMISFIGKMIIKKGEKPVEGITICKKISEPVLNEKCKYLLGIS